MEAEKYGIVIPVSDTLRAEHEALVSSMDAWFALSPEERARRAAEHEQRRRAERLAIREAAGDIDMGADSELVRGICRHFDWSPEYVRHLAQPYCDCGPEQYDGGWDYCEHARDLGFSYENH